MGFKKKYIKISLLIFLQICCFAQTNTKLKENEIAEKVKIFYSNLSTAEIIFEQVNSNSGISLSGKMFYHKGNKYNVDIGTNLIISDGTKVWNYNKKDNKVIISKASNKKNSFSPSDLFTLFPGNFKLELKSENKESYFLKCIAQANTKNQSLDIQSANLTVLKKNFTFKDIDFISNTYGDMKIKFNKSKFNIAIPDSKFNFVLPTGCKVIDLSK